MEETGQGDDSVKEKKVLFKPPYNGFSKQHYSYRHIDIARGTAFGSWRGPAVSLRAVIRKSETNLYF